jgi:hypothetical protein
MNKEQTENKKLSTDSKTSDVTYISVHDSRLTVRINSKLKEAFLKHCKAKGLSACHISEALFYGYLKGFYDKLDLDVKSPTINLTLVRDVKRVRRYAVEEEVEVSKEFCFYCFNQRKSKRVPAVGLFRYDKTGKVYPLCSHHAESLLESGVWSHV